ELESFAERFKQRRIKLGVTQADVGSALANLKIPGVGCLSQSTICRKRKRTSIAAPEKRSLEAYFAVQPRPSSEKIAAIAEKLDLKKNVVRVWFCNQRQKQKRM
ncbi:BRN3 protein, partial [Buphagus erythrorhynchus]|nr:BRN3 protein [Buphagus erythrorhynchus]